MDDPLKDKAKESAKESSLGPQRAKKIDAQPSQVASSRPSFITSHAAPPAATSRAKKTSSPSTHSQSLSSGPSFSPEEESTLRPAKLHEFVGQKTTCDRLSVSIKAARARGEPLAHCLLSGPPGLGKTTLAMIVAKEMGKKCYTTSGPTLEKAADLAGLLNQLEEGDVLFIDEIHRLSRQIEEYLYPAMEDFILDLMVDSGGAARSVQLQLQPFTLVGATTRQGLLTAPLRTRFGLSCRLDYYDEATLASIIERSSALLKMQGFGSKEALEIARRARGTPRVANNLLKWARDFCEIEAGGSYGIEAVSKALEMVQIDQEGLDEMDRRVLHTLIYKFEGGPVGLTTLALSVGEEAQTIEEVHEPYLVMKGFLKRTPRGRCATQLARRHLQEESLPGELPLYSG